MDTSGITSTVLLGGKFTTFDVDSILLAFDVDGIFMEFDVDSILMASDIRFPTLYIYTMQTILPKWSCQSGAARVH